MAIKLLALDLDDTLLNSKKDVSPEDFAAVMKAKEKGVSIVLATGRAAAGATEYNNLLGIGDYTIAIGGSHIITKDGKTIFSRCLPPEATKEILAFADEKGYYCQIYPCDGNHYFKKRTYRTDSYEEKCRYEGIESEEYFKKDDLQIAKILIIVNEEDMEPVRRLILQNFSDVSVEFSQAEYVEVSSPKASKGVALAFLADYLGIKREEVMAMGDSEIDSPMLEYAGVGVAMKNAYESVKKAADYVTENDCDHGGVAEAVNKFILGD